MKRSHFLNYVLEDLLSGMNVQARPMFGCFGLYRDGVIFGIVDEDLLYFKVDASNQQAYQTQGSQPLCYESKGKTVRLPYWEVPAAVMDDFELIKSWAEDSCQIAKKKPSKFWKRT